ncbi:metal ABC transporter ATP-binding protein [Chroogloeocystis siderophila]|jgi:manganese/iron transport system ATP-binding protein|uniref:Manganese ABC transporter ATP-binding protein n=1 Tax=Chroogloeocystis siderophila 5.2 s.c.1 TaxID=247279 RepID=A0A1U7I007_9CHRO|nr:metal ABC transporter ATP-binding protein [Chroogloeocystis siderophila]OKH29229.1 manganese ABC transporter ATP-binding protein [Chroogloeocystis siderophila 5.2 s.c.1]
MLEVQHLAVNYQGISAVEDVSFCLEPGQIVGVIGPNGAGKSTLVKGILGLVPTASGKVRYRARSLKQQLHSVAYVPQRSAIDWDYPITVERVVLMGRTVHTGWLREHSRQAKEVVAAAMERVGIYDLRRRVIGELSGGQQQRVFLARTLAQEAELFFFDEPFVGVDKKTESIMFEVFEELKDQGKILLLITHDLGGTLTQCDRLLLLNRKIIANGSLREVFTAENIQRTYGDGLLLLSKQFFA